MAHSLQVGRPRYGPTVFSFFLPRWACELSLLFRRLRLAWIHVLGVYQAGDGGARGAELRPLLLKWADSVSTQSASLKWFSLCTGALRDLRFTNGRKLSFNRLSGRLQVKHRAFPLHFKNCGFVTGSCTLFRRVFPWPSRR